MSASYWRSCISFTDMVGSVLSFLLGLVGVVGVAGSSTASPLIVCSSACFRRFRSRLVSMAA